MMHLRPLGIGHPSLNLRSFCEISPAEEALRTPSCISELKHTIAHSGKREGEGEGWNN